MRTRERIGTLSSSRHYTLYADAYLYHNNNSVMCTHGCTDDTKVLLYAYYAQYTRPVETRTVRDLFPTFTRHTSANIILCASAHAWVYNYAYIRVTGGKRIFCPDLYFAFWRPRFIDFIISTSTPLQQKQDIYRTSVTAAGHAT